jgi:histidyl-tRNA synthetase
VLAIEETLSPTYHKIARALRAAGIAAEVFPEKRKLAQQFSYAERKGIPLAVIVGTEEAAGGIVRLRDLETRASVDLPFPAGDSSLLVARAGELLARTKP